ncbi:MAG: hypothetical protein ACOYMW_14435 [Candidatus Competibacteraceae bacterium]
MRLKNTAKVYGSGSDTEPLLRLNVETRGNAELLERRTRELQTLIGG